MMPTIYRWVMTLSLVWMAAACKHTGQSQLSSDASLGSGQASDTSPKLCAAIRGNGQLIWAHFGSLARILETEGLVQGAAGGSSGSITTFLYESMLINPALYESCKTATCSNQEVANRVAFLMKTLPYWINSVTGSEEGQALAHIITVAKAIKSYDIRQLDATQEADIRAALKGLVTLLSSSPARSLINKDFLAFAMPLDGDGLTMLKFRAGEAKKELLGFGKFEATSPDILFRPGLLDFRGLVGLIGKMADFYAGYAPALHDDWSQVYASCTDYSLQKSPWDIATSSCGEQFRGLMKKYTAQINSVQKHRVNDTVGSKITAIVSTATLVKNQDVFEAARQQYLAGKGAELSLPLDSVKFGYASSKDVQSKLEAGMKTYPDERSQRFLALGAMRWLDILSVSPAEPGLAEALPFQDDRGQKYLSFGGWADLSPVMILQAAGCEKVIFVTRQGADSNFAGGVANLVGLGPVHEDLYSLANANSSFASSLNRADSIYCTNWDAYSGFSEADIQQLFLHAYNEGKILSGTRTGAPVGCAVVP